MDANPTPSPHTEFHKEKIIKDDGRYLIYYWFEAEGEATAERHPAVEAALRDNTEDGRAQ